MKKHLMWILEAFIWLFVIILLVMGLFAYKQLKLMQKHSYHVFFKDTDSLRNGAPVRYMGVEIGYVSNVKIINSDEIFVSFVITNKNITIPNGVSAQIESTGIVGSRSIELYPPETASDKTSDLIIPTSPRRMKNVFENSIRISDLLYLAANSVNKLVDTDKIPAIRLFIHTQTDNAANIGTKIDEINDAQSKYIDQLQGDTPLRKFNEKMEKFINEQDNK